MDAPVITNPNIMHGVPCFAGSRVTVKTLFDHLQAGYSIDVFLEQFPTVKREHVKCLLEQLELHAEQSAVAARA